MAASMLSARKRTDGDSERGGGQCISKRNKRVNQWGKTSAIERNNRFTEWRGGQDVRISDPASGTAGKTCAIERNE
jgi:hypothetical protein